MSEGSIRLEQCLFGYEDGHRLLASSIPLGGEAAALTELSDLAPGTVFGRSEGYWTGIPAPRIGRYALMRTWLAPEMPRPGCVWTHVLLLEPALLEKIHDLSALRPLFTRPRATSDWEAYRRALAVNGLLGGNKSKRVLADNRLVFSLLNSLYGAVDEAIWLDEPGDLDDSLFAVWSQQWPRLRRNFRFQTAVTREPRSSVGVRFDVTTMLGGSRMPSAAAAEPDGRWRQAAALDALGQGSADLRGFLWRYGADVRRQRGSFRPLVEVKLLHDAPEPDVGARVLRIVAGSFPESDDAILLKQELIDGELVSSAQLDVLWYVMAQGGEAVFPPPTSAGVSRLALLWPQRPSDLLHLAERTADADDSLGRSIFTAVTGAVATEEFWSLTTPYPRVRERMVKARPELLAAEGALDLDNGTMARMLRLVPAGTSVVDTILSRLLIRDDRLLAAEVFDLFPREMALQVVAAADGDSVRIGRAWLRELVRKPRILLEPAVMSQVSRASLLYTLAEDLGWLKPEVLSAGCDPWIAALPGIASDLPEDRRDTLNAFLVALAIASGGDGGRRVLENFFDSVHEQEIQSRLPWRARDILMPVLADVGWSKGWDYGLRLRLAVAAAYIRNNYPPESYAALSGRRRVRAMLSDAALQIEGGKKYARAVEA